MESLEKHATPAAESVVLIVDDNPDNLKLLAQMLTEKGFKIKASNSGEFALQSVLSEPPTLILLDIMMPGMDGFEVCRRLKDDPQTAEIPIIFISALADVENKIKAFAAGGVDYITKPFQESEVLARIKTHTTLYNIQHNLERLVENRTAEVLKKSRALQQSDKKYQEIFNATSEAIIIYDAESGTIVEANKRLTDMTGYTAKELRLMEVGDLSSGEEPYTRENLRDFFKLTIAGEPQSLKWCGRGKDGKTFWLELSLRSSIISTKSVVVLVARDISERLRVDAENKKISEQLQQSQKMEAIGTLAGGIAHDFNNILGAILGYADMAREDSPDDSSVAKDLDKVITAGYRARDLVKQILAFSRQTDEPLIPLQPAIFVKEVLKMLRSFLPSTITIKHNIAKGTGHVLAEPTQIHQIVMNICTNAFHAMEESGGELSVSLQENELLAPDLPPEAMGLTGGRFIEISISDSGPGIAPEIRDRIFEPYFTTKEVGKGTGMGLSIVHGLVKKIGGFITLDSTTGQGTHFHIFMPVVTQETQIENQVESRLQTGNERVLFVDDEEVLAEMGHNMLTRLGYRVTAETSSKKALELFLAQPDNFDLVITDQTMPEISGADFARKLMTIRPDLPVIICTGYSTILSENKARKMGINEFALKPLIKKEIAALVRKVLDGSDDYPDDKYLPAKWLPEYSVGIEEIDDQHKKLFRMLNNLYTTVNSENLTATIDKTIEDMASYASYHFDTEKSYLHHLPEFSHHDKEHWAFTKKTMQFAKEYRHNHKEITLNELRYFLGDWLITHIKGIDQIQFRLLANRT